MICHVRDCIENPKPHSKFCRYHLKMLRLRGEMILMKVVRYLQDEGNTLLEHIETFRTKRTSGFPRDSLELVLNKYGVEVKRNDLIAIYHHILNAFLTD
jgi:hypothetical protein